MKKALATSAISLVLAATPIIGVYADNQNAHDVTVGEVDETIYSVNINWGDLTFDWKYNADTNDFNFKSHLQCVGYGNFGTSDQGIHDYLVAARENYNLYSDAQCTVHGIAGEINEATTTYYTISGLTNYISVQDQSINGKVSASVGYSSTENYTWAVPHFATRALVAASGEIDYYTEGESLIGGRIYPIPTGQVGVGSTGPTILNKYFYISKDSSATIDPQSITTGDKIGTITINITPDTN